MAALAQNAGDRSTGVCSVKLNPFAPEFVPSSLRARSDQSSDRRSLEADKDSGNSRVPNNQRQVCKRPNNRGSRAQQETIRRTVYVSDVDPQVSEEQLATVFTQCGPIVDCRICGSPHSALHFAFIEFAEHEGAEAALNLCGTVLVYNPLRVFPSKTAIFPVNPIYLPRSEDEHEMCARTVYCSNIDKQFSQAHVKTFFEHTCGEVSRLRVLGDNKHSTRIAFVEFNVAECAIVALNCSGLILGSHPIRVCLSKTPLRPRVPRA